MRVEIKDGGDGVACWNAEAILAYVHAIDAREARLREANPDLVVTPGRVKCYGCRLNDFGLGFQCTAEVTRNLYAIAGEVAPRAADAGGSLADIDGLQSRIDTEQAVRLVAADPQPAVAAPAPAAPTPSVTAPVPPPAPQPPARRPGLGRLLGRRG